MKKEVLKEPIFAEKILRIIRSSPSMEEMREQLRDYHDNDIAQSLKYLNRAERNLLYSALDAEWLAEIISYIDDPVEYVDEIGIDKLSAIINEMDADDAVDLWENIDESVKVKLRPMIDDQTKAAILLINSYDDDEVGSLITTNYICIHQSLTIRQAMHELVRQAGENDNIDLCRRRSKPLLRRDRPQGSDRCAGKRAAGFAHQLRLSLSARPREDFGQHRKDQGLR